MNLAHKYFPPPWAKLLKWLKSKSRSIRFRLIGAFLFVSILPIFILQLVYFLYSGIEMTKKVSEMSKNSLTLVSKNIDTTLKSVNDVLVQICINDTILNRFALLGSSDDNIRLDSQQQISGELDMLSFSKDGVKVVTLYDGKNRLISYNRLNYDAQFWTDRSSLQRIYNEAIATTYPVIDSHPVVTHNSDGTHYLINYARKITDLQTLQPLGVAIISIDESVLYQACNTDADDGVTDDARTDLQSYSFLINNDGVILSSPNKGIIGKSAEVAAGGTDDARYRNLVAESGIYPGQPVIVDSVSMPAYQWKVVNIINKRKLFYELQRSQIIEILVACALMLLSLFLAFQISKSLSASIRAVVRAMRTAQKGEYSIQIDLDSGDEISVIARAFNSMMARINELIQDLHRQMQMVREATQKQKNAEIRALEAQLSPHFLYNTLDAINWMAIDKEEYEISRMLKSLASILRYSIEDSNKIVPIRSEAAWLEQYLYLQKSRFDNAFSYTVDIPEKIQSCTMHKLLLQPFIENSIVHGLSSRKEGGCLRVAARFCEEDQIEFTIRDNGEGMEPGVLAELNSYRGEDKIIEKKGRSAIGVRNVLNRLSLYYGENASCHIASAKGEGTLVTVRIPIMAGGGNA